MTKNSDTDDTCRDCRFSIELDSVVGSGLCRRHPPVVLWHFGDGCSNTEFPLIVLTEDWCGEFEARRNKPE